MWFGFSCLYFVGRRWWCWSFGFIAVMSCYETFEDKNIERHADSGGAGLGNFREKCESPSATLLVSFVCYFELRTYGSGHLGLENQL